MVKNLCIKLPVALYCAVLTSYLCLPQLIFAQQNVQKYYPECVPVNPEAAGMIKAINYPVGYNTGIPEISIPLYEIKSRSISIPITLSYHAGGFKAREVAPTTGLGWNLSTNFQIIREIHGFDDFWKSLSGYAGYYYNNYGITDALWDNALYTPQRLFEMANGSIDTQPDRFYYNILGKSGSFYLSKQQSNRIFLPAPYNGISISCTLSVNNTSSVDFKITDTDGTEYNFTIAEVITDYNYQRKSYESAWKCTSIVSPDKRDTILLNYRTLENEYSLLDEEYTELYEDLNGLQGNPGLSYGGTIFAAQVKLQASDSYANVRKKYAFFNLSVPRAINYSMGRDAGLIMYTKDPSSNYKFQTDLFHQDFIPFSTNAQLQTRYVLSEITTPNMTINLNYNTEQCMKLMQIADAHNRRIRSIYFDQTVVGKYESRERTNRTNYLDAIRIVDAKNKTITYSFEYSSKYAFANYTKGGNYWGGVNSWTVDQLSYGSGTTVPAFQVSTKYYQSNNYKDYIDNFKIWIGGGYLSSVMMHNRAELHYSSLGQLRKITYPTGGYTEFTFGPNYGYYIDNPSYVYQTGGVRIDEIQNYDTNGTLKNKKVFKYGENGEGVPNGIYYYSLETADVPFYYKQEVEYIVNPVFEYSHFSASARGILETKTTYLANILENMNYSNGAPVYYKKVMEYDYSESGENGMKEYIYTNPNKFGYLLHRKMGNTNLLVADESWRLGRLEQENTYRSVGYQKHSLIHSVTYDYDHTVIDRKSRTYMPFRKRIVMGVYVNNAHEYSHVEITDPLSLKELSNGTDYIELYSQEISTGAVYPIKKTETSYDGGKACSVVTQYQYDSYFQPTLTTVTYSDGHKKNESVSYAHHFSGNSPFIQKMKARNQIGIPIKIEQSSISESNEKTTGGVLRLFRADNPAQIEQIYVLAPGSQTPSFTEVGLTIPTGYYRKASFSYDALGNLVSRMTNDEPAIVYLWGYDNQYPVAEIKNSDYQTVCNALGSSVVATLQSSYDSADIRKRIQALRSHASMKDAQVRTFTYTPLFGVTEIIEADGLKTGYIYDGSARLYEVTGPDGNRASRNEYQYVH